MGVDVGEGVGSMAWDKGLGQGTGMAVVLLLLQLIYPS